MPAEQVIALLAFAFAAAVTPGPNNAMLLASGVNFGFRRTLPHMAGIACGMPVMILAAGVGIGQLFAAEPRLYMILKVISLIYLLWLAWRIATARPAGPNEQMAPATAPTSRPMTFLQAAAFQWVNPKGWIMVIGAFAAYAVPNSPWLSIFVIAAAFFLTALPSTAIWAAFGTAVRRLLANPAHARLFNVCMALLLVSSLWPVAAELFSAIKP